MTGQYSCGTCKIEFKNEDESLQCVLGDKWNHVFCVDIRSAEYEKLKLSTLPWYFPICAKKCHFPVYLIKNSIYYYLETHLILVLKPYLLRKSINKKEILKKLKDLNKLFDHTENAVSCDYFDINEYKKVKIKEQDFSLLHLNISSLLLAHINELKTLFSQVDTKFDISESRISKKNSVTTSIDIPGYNIEQTSTESSAGGSLIYIP